MSLDKEVPLQVIFDYLRSQEYFKALISLEQDSGQRCHCYSSELDFLYDLIIEGRFDDAEKFIFPLKSRTDFNYNRVLCEFRRQKFLEALESLNPPVVQDLVSALKELETISSKEDFSALCYCLSLNKITDHPEYTNWDTISGRYKCFEQCLPYFSAIFSINPYTRPEVSLEDLLAGGMIHKKGSPKVTRSHILQVSDPSIAASDDLKDPYLKKRISWNTEEKDHSDLMNEDQKKILIEAIDVPPPSKEVESDEHSSRYVPTNFELMSQFNPRHLKEIAHVQDSQPIRSSCFNTDGDYFLLGTNSKSLKICSLHNIVDGLIYNEQQGREQHIDTVFEMHNVHLGSVYCVDWSLSGRLIASGSNDKTIKIIRCPDFLAMQENNTETVVYSNRKFVNGEGGVKEIYEKSLIGHDGTVRAVLFNPEDDRVLYSGGLGEGCLKVWDTEVQVCVQSQIEHKGAINGLAAAGDGSMLTSVGIDKKIRIWDLKMSKCSFSMNAEGFTEMNSVAVSFSAKSLTAQKHCKIASLYSKRATSEGNWEKLIAVGHNDGSVSLWDITAGKLYKKFSYHTEECRAVDFSSNNNWLVTGGFDNRLGILEVSNGNLIKFESHLDKIVSVKWHPSLPIILSTSADKTARIFSI